jgi:predicted RNA-binding protein
MSAEPASYIVVTSPENWARTAERGWSILGLKSTKPGMAAAIKPGDRIVAYATGIKRLIGAVEVTSDLFVDHEPIWGSPKKAGEDYPNRFHTRPLITLEPDQYLDAFALARRLEYAKKWGDHVSLAFQGNIRPIPAVDFDTIMGEMQEAKSAVHA